MAEAITSLMCADAAACGAKTPEIHESALLLLRSRAPQLIITTSEDELSRQS
jgi:hypothetical protein